jgi:hypothetical protein
MFEKVVDSIRALPGKAQEARVAWLGEARTRSAQVRRRAWTLRAQGEVAAFDAGVDALARVQATLAKGHELPVVAGVVPRAEALVAAGQERLTSVSILDYDAMNVKQVVAKLDTLPRFELLRVRRHEMAGKRRKTVLDAVQRELLRKGAVAA